MVEAIGSDACEYEGIKKKMFGFSAGFWGFNTFDSINHIFPELSDTPFLLQGQRRPNKYHINRKYYNRKPTIDKVVYMFVGNKYLQGTLKASRSH
jgi:hypothetical protein